MTRRGFLETGLAASAMAQAANDRIRVGFVGAGARSHELMAAVQQHKDVEITGVVDAYTGRVQRAVERTGAKPYKDHRELFNDKSIDAVVIATPPRN
jgi:predicted dehydrogenase